ARMSLGARGRAVRLVERIEVALRVFALVAAIADFVDMQAVLLPRLQALREDGDSYFRAHLLKRRLADGLVARCGQQLSGCPGAFIGKTLAGGERDSDGYGHELVQVSSPSHPALVSAIERGAANA